MPRYGSDREGMEDVIAGLRQRRAAQDELIAREIAAREQIGRTTTAEESAHKKRAAASRGASDAVESEARAVRTYGEQLRLDTEAMRANTAARRDATAARRAESAAVQAAARGRYGAGTADFAATAAQFERQRRLREEMGVQAGGGGSRPPRRPPPPPPPSPPPPPDRPFRGFGGAQPPSYAVQAEATRNRTALDKAVPESFIERQSRLARATQLASAASEREAQILAELRAQSAQADRAVAGAASSQGRYSAATRQAGVELGTLSSGMRRHGELTSDFIQATARGETTVRQLGRQTAVTVGKFAGWTAAAAGVYGALGAISSLGEGAIETNNAIQNLQRFIEDMDTSRAREQLRGLAVELNVPIATVSDASQQFARVFDDQDSAFEAARAAILATKLDNVATSVSYRGLVAAIQGFKLEARDIPSLFDQINAAQRDFGAPVGQIFPGFGRAAGPYAAQGGTPEYLKALLATGIVSTGLTGPNIATAIQRSASTFIHKPVQKGILESYGIDPEQDYDRIIDQAFRVIEQRRLGGRDVNQIAQGLAGPQLGSRVYTAILLNGERFRKILEDTAPQNVAGTANHELEKRLHSLGEELDSVGISLQSLGSQLEQSGAFAPLHVLLRTLSGILGVTTDLIGAFGELPGPLKTAATVGAGIATATAVQRRFGGDGSLAGKIPILGNAIVSPEARAARLVRSSLRDASEAAEGRVEGYARANVRAQFEAEVANRRIGIYANSPEARAAAAMADDTVERQAYNRRIATLTGDAARATAAATVADEKLLAAKSAAAAVNRQVATVSRLNATQTVQWARGQDFYSRASFERPELQALLTPGALPPPGAGPTRFGGAVQRYGTRGLARTESALNRLGGVGYSGRFVLGAGSRAVSAASRSVSAVERGVTRLRTGTSGFFSKVGSFTSSLSAFDKALLGFVGFEILRSINDSVSDSLDKANRSLEDAAEGRDANSGRRLTTLAEMRRNADRLQKRADDTGFFEDFWSGVTLRPYSPSRVRQDAADVAREQADAIERSRRYSRVRGNPIANLGFQEIKDTALAEVEDYRRGRITLQELREAFARHMTELEHSVLIDTHGAQVGRQFLASRLNAVENASGPSYARNLRQLGQQALQKAVEDTALFLEAFGGDSRVGDRSRNRLLLQAREAQRRYTKSGSVSDFRDFVTATDEVTEALQAQIRQDLEINLALARTERERQQAYDSAIGQTVADVEPAREAYQAALRQRRRAAANVRSAENRLEARRSLQGRFQGPEPVSPRLLDQSLRHYRQELRRIDGHVSNARELLRRRMREARAAEEELKDAALADFTAGVQVRGDLALALNQDPAAQAARRIADARRIVAFAAKRFAANDRRVLSAQADLQKAIVDGAQQQLDAIEQQTQINQALATTQEGELIAGLRGAEEAWRKAQQLGRNRLGSSYTDSYIQYLQARKEFERFQKEETEEITGLQFDLAAARHEGNPLAVARDMIRKAKFLRSNARTTKERLEAEIDLVNAQNEFDSAVADITDARFELRESRTTDPLKIDRIELEAAKERLKRARRTGSTADILRARAEVNNARHRLIDDRASQRLDDVQFAIDAQKIGYDAAIGELRGLLRMRGLSREKRREIQRQILALRKEADSSAQGFNLDVGNIKLPTLYDVRRALGPAARGAAAVANQHTTMNQRNQVTIYVDEGWSRDEIVAVLEEALGTSVRAKRRTSRARRRGR